MEKITLGQIQSVLLFIVGIGGATITIVTAVKKAINKAFEPIQKRIDDVDMNATKNFLVRSLSDIERGEKLDGVERMRFFEQLEHYVKLGGNSYIKDEVERLKKENKL